MSFKSICEDYFGTDNFYEVLGVKEHASDKEIKKAYHRMSLLVHPDRVTEDQKVISTEKFKALGKIHSILQDKAKRKLYDDCGEFDEDSDSLFNWTDYWLKMFKPIDIKDIENCEKEYIGSEIELRDIKKAYVGTKGDWNKILELVPFSHCDSEPRIRGIVEKMVDDGEVERYPAFFNENKQKRTRRHRKYEKERKEVEAINSKRDMQEFEQQMEESRVRRAESFGSLISSIEAKYAPKKKRLSVTEGRSKRKI